LRLNEFDLIRTRIQERGGSGRPLAGTR